MSKVIKALLTTAATDSKDAPGEKKQAQGAAADLSNLLDALRFFLCDYIVFPQAEQAAVIALWIVHTWVAQAFDFTPYLSIASPVKRCGKSTLLDCLKLLCRAPWQAVSPTPAVLYRKIELDCPTLLLDEADTIFTASKGDDGKEELRAVLNAGFQRGAKVPRCVGPTHQLVEFGVFCPKAIAGIGKLPDTVADRSIPIILARCAPGQKGARFRRREVSPRADELRAALASWAETLGLVDALANARPPIPDTLSDRAADIGEPLLALADLAGDHWPEQAREALVKLCGSATMEDDNLGAKLLTACREIFAEQKAARLPTRELLDKLIEREDDGPWAQWWEADVARGNTRGPAARLSRLLKPFGIVRRDYREDGEIVKGYLLDSFADAFARYLPSEAVPTTKSGNSGDND